MNDNNNSFGSKFISFAEDKGFYIILMLCVVAIGISGYVLFVTPEATKGTIDVNDFQPTVMTPPIQPGTTVPDVTVELEPEDTQANAPAEVTVTDQAEPPAAETVFFPTKKYNMPLSGEVIKAFVMDKLVYDETMGDWRTHNGLDISCAVGDRVTAIADGTVKAVYEDALKGTCIEISHAKDIVSIYCGLAANKTMAVGMKVKAGDVIGAAGGTMKTESKMQPHLHLEVLENGEYIDPASLKLQ